MLAQPEGKAAYDRVSWEALLSAVAGHGHRRHPVDDHRRRVLPADACRKNGLAPNCSANPAKTLRVTCPSRVLHGLLGRRSSRCSPAERWPARAHAEHVARLGGELFGRHLIAIEVAGTLLLAALVGRGRDRGARKDGTITHVPRNRPTEQLPDRRRVLFGIGLVGFMSRRNMIVMFLAAEMMLQGVSLSLVAWSRFHNNFGGQMLVIFIIAIAACEAAIVLGLVTTLFQRSGRLDIADWHALREANQPAFATSRCRPSPPSDPPEWPHLAPAGVAAGDSPRRNRLPTESVNQIENAPRRHGGHREEED